MFFNFVKNYLILSNDVSSTTRYHEYFMNIDAIYCQILCSKGLLGFFIGFLKISQGCFEKTLQVTSCLFQGVSIPS